MAEHTPQSLNVVVMAKQPVPGRVKTRMIGRWTAEQAAMIHAAMLECVLHRLNRYLPGRLHLALDGFARNIPAAPAIESQLSIPNNVKYMDQGRGDLGDRLKYVWSQLNGHPTAFFGIDSPDVPEQALTALPAHLKKADALVGPVEDGGYWCLAVSRFHPALVTGIDWGTSAVYHQTHEAGRLAGLCIHDLPPWHDVDTAEDLDNLLRRLSHAQDPALVRLKQRLQRISEDTIP
ncbi:MAG: DUF2064 domain-containing protein [Phycisphaeraceae bacterium]